MKKGQLEVMQNIFILLIIFVILIIAFVFAVFIQKNSRQAKLEDFDELDVIKRSQIISYLPEMQCSENNNVRSDCYDIYKIESFKEHAEDTYYRDLFGQNRIEVSRFDPSPNIDTELQRWVIYDNPPPQDRGLTELRYPILLYDPIERSEYFGLLRIGVYR